MDGTCNLLSLLGYRRFKHGIAEPNSVVRPGENSCMGSLGKMLSSWTHERFGQGLLSPIFRHLERNIRVRCKRWCDDSMSVGCQIQWELSEVGSY